MKLSKLAENLQGSEIVKIGNEINARIAEGEKIMNLTIGDINPEIYPIPEALKNGIKEAYDKGLTNYPPAAGLLSLRKSVAEDLKKRWQLEYDPADILIAGGSRPLIYACFRTIVDTGDKVIFPVPSWNNNHYTYLNGGEPVVIHTKAENKFLPTAEDLKGKLEGAVLLALCSPLNPTGTMFHPQQLKDICEMVIAENKSRGTDEKPLYIMYDQIYANLTFGGEHTDPVSLFPELRPYTVYIDGSSKCMAATGLRVGWSFGPAEVMSKMRALLTHVGAWAPKPEQAAEADFILNTTAYNDYLKTYNAGLEKSLHTLHEGFQSLKKDGFAVDSISPMGALYLTVKLDYLGAKLPDGNVVNSSSDLNFYLIKNGIALVPFSSFGEKTDKMWLRASVGTVTEQELKDMLEKLRSVLQTLQ